MTECPRVRVLDSDNDQCECVCNTSPCEGRLDKIINGIYLCDSCGCIYIHQTEILLGINYKVKQQSSKDEVQDAVEGLFDDIPQSVFDDLSTRASLQDGSLLDEIVIEICGILSITIGMSM